MLAFVVIMLCVRVYKPSGRGWHGRNDAVLVSGRESKKSKSKSKTKRSGEALTSTSWRWWSCSSRGRWSWWRRASW